MKLIRSSQKIKAEYNCLSAFSLNQNQQQIAHSFNQLCRSTFATIIQDCEDEEYYTCLRNTTRFLIARYFDVQKAISMWKNWCVWRVSFGPHKISMNEIMNELKTGKAFHFGKDKYNNSCIVIRMCKNDPRISEAETLKFGVWLIETSLQLAEFYGGGKVVVIIDRQGVTKKQIGNGALNSMKELIRILQDYYPETLKKLYVVGKNWLSKLVFVRIKPFIDEKTKQKMQKVGNTNALLADFDKDNLITEMGGQVDFNYDPQEQYNIVANVKNKSREMYVKKLLSKYISDKLQTIPSIEEIEEISSLNSSQQTIDKKPESTNTSCSNSPKRSAEKNLQLFIFTKNLSTEDRASSPSPIVIDEELEVINNLRQYNSYTRKPSIKFTKV